MDGTAAARPAGAAATVRPGPGSSPQGLSSPGGPGGGGALRVGWGSSVVYSPGRELSPVRARPKSLGPSEDNSSPALFTFSFDYFK